jgi:hypothetical protein
VVNPGGVATGTSERVLEQAHRRGFLGVGGDLVPVLAGPVVAECLGGQRRDDGRQRVHDDGLGARSLDVHGDEFGDAVRVHVVQRVVAQLKHLAGHQLHHLVETVIGVHDQHGRLEPRDQRALAAASLALPPVYV